MSLSVSVLSAVHDRTNFSCGKESLDNYLRKQARQDVKKKVTACFILSDDGIRIIGYYTLSTGSIPREQLPGDWKKNLPLYKDLPVTILGRLAIDHRHKKKGYGALLLIDAMKRSLDASKAIGSMAIVVDPIDREAQEFYSKYGFILLPGSGRMFLPMATLEMAMGN